MKQFAIKSVECEDIGQIWKQIKESFLYSASEVCGSVIVGINNVNSEW